MKEVMSWPNAMKEHLPGLVSPGFSSASKDPSKESKKRPIQCTRKNGVDEDGSAEKKSRLTVEQIKFLEASFNSDIKLEPERKAHIAKQLGVRPRQVAIWFQNRRARWKNKQVEHEYEMLKASYEAVEKEKENLMKDYEVALEGNKRLQAEVARLTSLLQSIKDKDVRNNLPPTNEEQLSDKSELMSPTKSAMDEQSEVEDLVMPSDVNEAAATGTSIEELDSAIACATRLEGENAPYLPSYVILSSLPVLVQQLIANGYGLEDAMHIFWNCEDTFGSGFTLYESS